MSQEQIERILKSDFSYIDEVIDAKINSIDEIADKLQEKSNFLAQFQILLQSQLSNIKSTSKPVNIQMNQQIIDTSIPLSQNITTLPSSQIQDHQFPQIKQEKLQQNNEIFYSKLHTIRMEIQQFKIFINFLKEEITTQISYFKAITQETLINGFKNLYLDQKRNHQQQNSKLQTQINVLKQEIKKMTETQRTLKELTFQNCNNEKENIFDFTYKFQQLELKQNNWISLTQQKENRPVNNDEWKTNRNKYQDSLEVFEVKNRQKENMSQYLTLPPIKPIVVGIPPVKNGFGILKTAKQIIYKGMWKDGKFDGSGKLNWQSYCYQGNFSSGCFQGHGKLQLKDMMYVGKFHSNKANGEGTLDLGYKKVMGLWDNNKLIRIF